MRIFLSLTVLTLVVLSAPAAEPPRAARGMVIYKPSGFRPDTTAVLLEYLGQENHERVTYFLTMKGRRIAVIPGRSEVIFLPYPGRGEATPDQAFALLALARERFPQFGSHYILYQRAWRDEARRPPAEIAAEISRRTKNEQAARDFAGWVRSLFPKLAPPDLPPNPLTAGKAPPPSAPEAVGPQPEREEQDLESTLRQLQDFYRLSSGISGEP